MLKMICAAALLMAAVGARAEAYIPRSVPGDKGTYYLLESKRTRGIVLAVHKRVGPNETGYTRTETDCSTMKVRVLGYSEESPRAIKDTQSEWADLVPGSSRSDVAHFVCRR